MASQLPTNIGSASALPLATALSVIPSLPRPLLSRLVERAIERLDEIDGEADLEDAGDFEPTDEREPEEGVVGNYGADQRIVSHSLHRGYKPWDTDRECFAENA